MVYSDYGMLGNLDRINKQASQRERLWIPTWTS
jgi:hypothetical protein